MTNERPYIVIKSAGSIDESFEKELETYDAALGYIAAIADEGDIFDIAKRLPDGSITFDF